MDYPYNFIENTIISPYEVMSNFLAIKTSDSLKASIAQLQNLQTSFEQKFNSIVDKINTDLNLVGFIFPYAGDSEPSNGLLCSNHEYSRETYNILFAKIGTRYGIGDGVTTFNVPDLRALVIRGLDNGRGYDPGREFGSYQADATQKVYGRFNSVDRSPVDGVFRMDYRAFTTDTYKNTVSHYSCSFDNSRVIRTADEERMKNIAFNYYIIYK